MKLLLSAIAILGLAQSASACMDRDAKPFPLSEVKKLAERSPSFAGCIFKMAFKGVNPDEMTATLKNRAEGDQSSVAYTITVQGKDSADRTTRLAIKYDLSKREYVCGKPSNKLARCM